MVTRPRGQRSGYRPSRCRKLACFCRCKTYRYLPGLRNAKPAPARLAQPPPQDLPVQGHVVKINLALNRWQCRHRKCGRRTFTDRLPEIASPYMRRTERMAEIVGLIGHRMGGRPGEYLMHRLGMPVSDDTILRQLKRDNPASIQR